MQKGQSLNDFKSGTPMGRFPSGGTASTAVKGLNAPNFFYSRTNSFAMFCRIKQNDSRFHQFLVLLYFFHYQFLQNSPSIWAHNCDIRGKLSGHSTVTYAP